jgi:hypothetical protein
MQRAAVQPTVYDLARWLRKKNYTIGELSGRSKGYGQWRFGRKTPSGGNMDKKIAGLLGAAAALTTMTAANAGAASQSGEVAPATSYRDLLDPIPNPIASLRADDVRLAETPAAEGTEGTQVAQNYHHHHHHHHHHHVIPRPIRRVLPHRHHHHHHHHHH